MTGVSRKGCLDRRLVKSLGAGRCPKEELATAQRHLSECARCRAAVVAAASGLRGPGETVVMMRRASATAPAGVKVAAVLVSLLVAGWAWGYGSAPQFTQPKVTESKATESKATESKATEPPGAAEAGDGAAAEAPAAPSDEPAALREATPRQSLKNLAPALPLGLPAAQEGDVRSEVAQDGVVQVRRVQDGVAREDAPPVPPTVTVVTSAATVERPRSRRRRQAPPAAPTRPAVEEGAKPDEEVDFGIDEPAPRIRKHVRTTLD